MNLNLNLILTFFRVLFANLPLARIYLARWRYMAGKDSYKHFLVELRAFCEGEGREWPQSLDKRLGYYLTGVDWFLHWMVGWKGEKLQPAERRLGWYMAVMFSLGDELSEEGQKGQGEIRKAVLEKEKKEQSTAERLIAFAYQNLLTHHPDIHAFEKYLTPALRAQDDSLLQKGSIPFLTNNSVKSPLTNAATPFCCSAAAWLRPSVRRNTPPSTASAV